MKKIIAIVLSLLLVSSLTACGARSTQTPQAETPTHQAETPTPQAETPTPQAETPEPTLSDEEAKYQTAMALFNEQKYKEAENSFLAISGYKDSKEMAEKSKAEYKKSIYNQAIALMNSKQYVDAIELFNTIRKYEDAIDKISECELLAYGEEYVNAKIGDIYVIGKFEQDNDLENGAEDIEWVIIDKVKGQFLLASKYVLINKPFHSTNDPSVTWETSDLRYWLNNDFYNAAFSDEEKARLQLYTCVPENEVSGNETQDNVFIFSHHEMEDLCPKSKERQIWPTAYAIANGVLVRNSTESYTDLHTCWWWLRTKPMNEEFEYSANSFMVCYSIGSIDETTGHIMTLTDRAVRPGILVKP